MKLLGLDYGRQHLGLAIGDTELRLASPLITLKNGPRFWNGIAKILKEEEIGAIVIGWPLSLSGGAIAGEALREVQTLSEELGRRFALPIYVEDERFSTDLAARLLVGRKKDQDAVAAAVILQSYLDRL